MKKPTLVAVLFAATLVVGVAFTTNATSASIIDWTLSGVTFGDGGTASGTFATYSGNGGLAAYDITTTQGSTLAGAIYDQGTSGETYLGSNSFILALYSNPQYDPSILNWYLSIP
jgi:hypothetical protein